LQVSCACSSKWVVDCDISTFHLHLQRMWRRNSISSKRKRHRCINDCDRGGHRLRNRIA
jgi:hypothetical protein